MMQSGCVLVSLLVIILCSTSALAYERCGAAKNGISCKTGRCCSKYGYCGEIEDFCLEGCQPTFGLCGLSSASTNSPAPILPLPVQTDQPTAISWDGTCGLYAGKRCPDGFCCSKFGFCGASPKHCGDGCQSRYGICPRPSGPASGTPTPSLDSYQTTPDPVHQTMAPVPALPSKKGNDLPVSDNGECGASVGTRCPDGICCSQFGFCGITSAHCTTGCQPRHGRCTVLTTPAPSFCGLQNGNRFCPDGLCCGPTGECGVGDNFCAAPSCQAKFGSCNLGPLPSIPARSFEQIFSPYVLIENWSFSNYAAVTQPRKIRWLTMAFVISNNGVPYWGSSWRADGTDPEDKVWKEIRALRQVGTDAICSFGGAAGDELATVIQSDKDLLNAYQSVISGYDFNFVDFDIEGAALADWPTIQRRNRVLAHLQKNNSALLLSFTLPVMPSGLTDIGLNLLRDAFSVGVRIDAVNIMAMDYGTNGIDMGKAAIEAIQSTQAQLKTLGLTCCVGIIPMIGVNDVEKEVFRQGDARELKAFVADLKNGVCISSFWSLDRDNSQSTRIAQTAFEFTNIAAGVQ